MNNDVTLKAWMLDEATTTTTSLPSILIMDGGVSTHLEHLLLSSSSSQSCKNNGFEHRALWSSSLLLNQHGNEIIKQGHQDWLNAGAQIITTVTYQCHYGTMQKLPNGEIIANTPPVVASVDAMTNLLQTGVKLAKEVIVAESSLPRSSTSTKKINDNNTSTIDKKFVVASTGCYGAALANGSEYTGIYPPELTIEKLMEFHGKKIHTLLSETPHGIAIETIPSGAECKAIIDYLSNSTIITSSDTAIWMSLSCRNGKELNDGTKLEHIMTMLRSNNNDNDNVMDNSNIHGIGLNCCDSAHLKPLLEIMVQDMAIYGPKRAIIIYPNSGEVWDAENETWQKGTGCTSPKDMAQRIFDCVNVIHQTWQQHGAKNPNNINNNINSTMKPPNIILGGCCRTSPDTIRELRTLVDEYHINSMLRL